MISDRFGRPRPSFRRMDALRDETGAAVVEFALVLVLLLTLLVGLIQFGLAFYTQLTLQHAAREGARVFAITQDVPLTKSRTKAAAGQLNPPLDETNEIDTGTLAADGTFTISSTCTNGAQSGVLVRRAFNISLPTFTIPVQLEAKGVMRCGG